ncbi:hypothetical protein LPJ61_002426 [Coemansia biformis]|uniref:Uncharacterized protein n=1 Tax=Coemansia biformis TaxID=1286918 RepID=A0A9W8CZN9_9FUNG|nr:hypothetical protein LPJ61_002426 [Coemansia biformis]
MQARPQHAAGAPGAAASISGDDAIRRTARVLRQLYHRERQWLAARTAEQAARLTQQGLLRLSDQLHYGEIAFVLLRLKPCVLVDFAGDRDQLRDYIAGVVAPSLRDLNAVGALGAGARDCADTTGACYPRRFRLVCARIDGELASPEVASWTGAYVVYDETWPESDAWARDNLLNPAKTTVSEAELARGLDYPGSIPQTPEDMRAVVPVSYLGRIKSESGEWMSDRWECLTSYAVLQHELPQTALHRMRYQAIRMFGIEIQVNMDTSMIDEFPMQ